MKQMDIKNIEKGHFPSGMKYRKALHTTTFMCNTATYTVHTNY